MHRIATILCALVSLFSSFFIIAAAGDLAGGTSDTEPGILWGLVVFFSLTFLGGIYGIIRARAGSKLALRRRRERTVLELVAAQGGRITPFQVAAASDLSAVEARTVLDHLCDTGMGELHVTEEGNLLYVFRGAISEAERETARSPL